MELDEEGTVENNQQINYKELFLRLRQNGPLNPRSFESRQFLLKYIKQKLNGNDWSEDNEKKIMFQISNFIAVLLRLWKKSTRNINKFYELNKEWLKKYIVLPSSPAPISGQVGRPQKLFEDCTDRSKRRKIQPLIKSYTSPEILFAAKSKLHKAGNITTVGLVNETLASPKRGIKIKKAYMSSLSISTKEYDTDDGNTARRFFRNPEKTTDITGIKIELIQRFRVILTTLASGRDINITNFDKYSLRTAELFVSLYPWYYMPASIHTILDDTVSAPTGR